MRLTTIKDVITDKISGEWGDEALDDQGVVVIRTANFLNSGQINFSNLVRREIDQKKIEKKRLISGDIIIEKSGGSPTQPVGRVVIFRSPDNDTYLCNNFTSILRPNRNEIHPEYLFYVLHDNHKKGKTLRHQNKTTGIINLKLDSYLDSEIPLPPLDDQKRIAHLLGKVEGLIAMRKQHLQQLDDLLKSVFLEMFGDHAAMKQQQHFLLGDFIEFLTSGSRGWAKYYSDTGNIFLRINNVKDGRLKLDDVVYVNAPDSAEANRTRVRSGDLLLSITADLGRTAVIPKGLDGSYINQHLALIRIKEEAGFNPIFLAWYFSLPYGNSFIQKKNREGVKAGLNFDDIRSFQVVKPSIALQNQFAVIVEKVEGLKDRYRQSLTDLESLYGALSRKAFKGELDLSRVVLPAGRFIKRNGNAL